MKKHSYQAKDEFVTREIAGELLLIPVGTRIQEFNGMVRLNETGMFIWESIQEPKTIDELVQAVVQNFEISAKMAETDIQEFITNGLLNQLLIEI